MNPFFDISENTELPEDALPLRNLGAQLPWLTVGRRSSDFWGTDGTSSKTTYRATTSGDYDQQFIRKLLRWKPIYQIDSVLDHHYYHYLNHNQHSQSDFLKHLRYVILPLLKKKPNAEVCVQLFEGWLQTQESHKPTADKKMTGNSNKVFISYAKEDYSYAEELYNYLQLHDYDPWLDKKCLLAGANWDMEIKKALRQSDFIILLLSDTSISKRGYVQREYKLALQYWEEKVEDDIYIIPILINECEVPVSLNRFQWLQYDEDAFALIVSSLNVQRKKLIKEPEIINLKEDVFVRPDAKSLAISKKIHDEVANGLYHLMVELDGPGDLDRQELMERLEKIYEHSRDISYEQMPTEDFSEALTKVAVAFADADCRIAIVGNTALTWKGPSDKTKYDLLQVIQLLLNVFIKYGGATTVQLKFKQYVGKIFVDCQYEGSNQISQTNLNPIFPVLSSANAITHFAHKPKGAKIEIQYPLQ